MNLISIASDCLSHFVEVLLILLSSNEFGKNVIEDSACSFTGSDKESL